jgi:hypothetical protein
MLEAEHGETHRSCVLKKAMEESLENMSEAAYPVNDCRNLLQQKIENVCHYEFA